MYTPVNPSFTIQNRALRGSKLYRHVFVMSDKCNGVTEIKLRKNHEMT